MVEATQASIGWPIRRPAWAGLCSNPEQSRSRVRQKSNVALSSMPSATMRKPIAWPSSIVDRTRSRSRSVRGFEALDEVPVELELADSEAAQVGQRRDPGAEVVDRDDETQSLQLLDDPSGGLELRDDAVSVISRTRASREDRYFRAGSRTISTKPVRAGSSAETLTETPDGRPPAASRRTVPSGFRRAPTSVTSASVRLPRPEGGTCRVGAVRAAGDSSAQGLDGQDLAGSQVELGLVVQHR